MAKPNKPYPRRPKTPVPPTMHVRLSAEMWLDVYLDHFSSLALDNDNKMDPRLASELAHAHADIALEAYERRWPNIKLLGGS